MPIELLNVDCMEYMATLEDSAFDILITSPPYNMNIRVNSRGDGYCSRQIAGHEFSSKYSNFSDNLPMADYRKFLSGFISEATRVSKMAFINIQQITGNKPAIFQAVADNADALKETIIWDKIVSQPAMQERTLNSQFEYIFVFGGNPIARQFKAANFDRGRESNVWQIGRGKHVDSSHGATFPLAIPEKILNLFGIPGCLVFDPFMGLGTTAIAAHYFGCDFVGCELDEDYYKAACERFDQETKQENLF